MNTNSTVDVGRESCFRSIKGYFVTKLVLEFIRLGLIKETQSGTAFSCASVAAEHSLDKELLESALNYLSVQGYYERQGEDRFRMTERGQALLPWVGYYLMIVGSYEPVFDHLGDVLKGTLVYDKNLGRNDMEVTLGVNQIEDFFLEPFLNVVRPLQFSKVLDIGCGNANVLSSICSMRADIQGIGVDYDIVACNEARAKIERLGLSNRIDVLHMDAVDIDSIEKSRFAGVDLIVTMFFMHEILKRRGRQGTAEYIRKLCSMLTNDGTFLFVEVAKMPAHSYRDDLLFVPEYELIHDFSNQRLASKDEWQAMLVEAGVEIVDVKPAGVCQAFAFVAKRK